MPSASWRYVQSYSAKSNGASRERRFSDQHDRQFFWRCQKLAQAVVFHFLLEGGARQPQSLRGSRDISLMAPKGFDDVIRLEGRAGLP